MGSTGSESEQTRFIRPPRKNYSHPRTIRRRPIRLLIHQPILKDYRTMITQKSTQSSRQAGVTRSQ